MIGDRVAEIVRTTGIPAELARRVALGKLDLNEAIKALALKDQVEGLVARHGLDRALATQIAVGHADLERALRKRRIEALLAQHRGRDIFVEAQASRAELTLGVHGRELLRCTVEEVLPYEVRLMNLDTQADVLLHKTRTKFACLVSAWPKARKAMTWDDARKAKAVDPILRPQDRYGCSNQRLAEAADAGTDVTATLVEGEQFAGHVAWVARWEFGIRTKSGQDIVIFRHALDDFRD